MNRLSNLRATGICTLGLCLALGLSACSTKRYLTIQTNPPGAAIWVNGEKLAGTTPVVVPFTHYGRFDVRVEKAGHQSVARELHIKSGLDGYPVIDLPLELMRRERRFTRLIEMPKLPTDRSEAYVQDVIRRAEVFRERTHREVAEPGTPLRTDP